MMPKGMSDGGTYHIVPYGSYTAYTPALPQFYWDVYSAEQRIKHICYEIDKIIAYANMLGINLNATHDDVVKLQELFQKFQDQGLAELYEKLLQQWVDDNMERIISRAVKFVYFGLTNDGYFCAYIPDSWDEITFDTGAVYGRSDYGRLILKMQTDSPNSINNTYSYSLSQSASLKQLIADLEINAKRTDSTFDTLFTNLDSDVVATLGNTHSNQTITKDGDNA